MAFNIAHGCPATVEYPLSTIAVTHGMALVNASGYLTNKANSSAVPIIAVSAEDKNGVISGRSALGSTTVNGDHKVLAYPVTEDVRFIALCSSTPTTAMIGTKYDVNATSVLNETTTADGAFLIEGIVDATAKLVLGRFISRKYSYHS